MIHALIVTLGALTLAGGPAPGAARIEGDYIEARTADVYTGPCFSNAEVLLTGHQGLMAWKIRAGSWNGVDLSGLTVAAAVRGNTTLSKDDPALARAVLIVDERATPAERDALVSLARELGGRRLENLVRIESALMNVFVEENHEDASAADEVSRAGHEGMPHAARGSFWAAGVAEIKTRPLGDSDHLCGNEVVEYQPLSKGVDALPAYTLAHSFKGAGLDTRWDDHNCRSSFVGHFRS
jgi:hypothetical protein